MQLEVNHPAAISEILRNYNNESFSFYTKNKK